MTSSPVIKTMTSRQIEAANRYMHPQHLEAELQEIGIKSMHAKEIALEFATKHSLEDTYLALQNNGARHLINILQQYIHIYLERL